MMQQNNVPDKETLLHVDKIFSDSIIAHTEMIIKVSMFTIRWLVIINGSACVALLALIGNTWGKETKVDFMTAILPAVAWFASACVLALLGAGGLYFNIFYITQGLGISQKKIICQICGDDDAAFDGKFKQCGRKVNRFKCLAIIFLIASLISFVAGGAILYCNLNGMLSKQS